MPHAQSMPPPGFQALILCGPGVSLNTFTSSPQDFPKALVPIANRPMVWYPIDWCYRMGITNINLITPPSSASAISTAMSMDPSLSSLPVPKPDIIAPIELTENTGTAAILRLPEVRAAITDDFLVLPCDLVAEFSGSSLIESWMIREAGFGGALGGKGERSGRRGGLSVWYSTKDSTSVKGEETDFLATSQPSLSSSIPPPTGSLLPHISNVVYSLPTDTLHDVIEAKKTFPLRHSLIRAHPRIKMLTTHRDAHVYFFPHWVLDFVARNPKFDSINEDVVGWWAKAGWQDGLGDKLGLRDVFSLSSNTNHHDDVALANSGLLEDDIDLASMTSTASTTRATESNTSARLASRVQQSSSIQPSISPPLIIPPILSYVHPSSISSPSSTSTSTNTTSSPLLHRVDTTPLLLHISLLLARLPPAFPSNPSPSDPTPSPLSHPQKIHALASIASRTTITPADTLIGANASVAEKCVVKESVVGAGSTILTGARLTRCVLFEGVSVGERCVLSGCVLGKGARVENGCTLRDCEVQGGMAVGENTNVLPPSFPTADAKSEKFMVFEGLEESETNDENGGDNEGMGFGGDAGEEKDGEDAEGIDLTG
ncbi:MAG: hypothetical protein M1833_002071 [Piccolia ochrophora]|nr:MAG: hypothetical protein M1833_002071 [Piccolia ochrophora]